MKKQKKLEGITNYPVGDFLIRIKNAAAVGKKEIFFASTKKILALARILEKAGFLEEVKNEKGILSVKLTIKRKEPVLMGLKLISKPGLRIYMGLKDLEKIKGPSIFLISTSKGVMASNEAKKKRLGGEIISEVW